MEKATRAQRNRGEDFPIEVFESLASTNDTILEAGASGADEGTTHVALEQTRGRGRGSHAWWSPPGAGLWMSTLLRPTRDRSFWGGLSLLAGVAAREALRLVGVTAARVYWPNDLRVGLRKIGGILGESRARGDRAWLALGLGSNIEFTPEIRARMPEELRDIAVSMAECGQPTTKDPVALARLFLAQVWPLYEDFERGEDLARLVGPLLGHAGKVAEIQPPGGAPWRGRVQGIGPRGELLVRWEGAPRAEPPPGSSWLDPEARLLAVRRGHVAHCPLDSLQSG